MTNPEGATFIWNAVCTGWSTAEVRSPQTWCRVLVPEARATGDTPKAPIPQAQTWLEEGEAGRQGQLNGEFYFPFMVKALRSSVLFFTSRTVKRLNNKPFGCYKCVNMTLEFCTKCWRFSWRVRSWFGFLSFLLPSPLSFFWERVRAPCFLKLWPYKFLQVSAMNLNVGNSPPFCFLSVPLFLCHTVLTCSCHRLPGDRHSPPGMPAPASLLIKKSEGVSFIIISKIFCMAPTMRAHVSIISSGEKHFFSLVSSGIQRIKSVWRRRDRIMVLNKYTEENSRDSSFIYLFISFFQNNFRQFSITPVYTMSVPSSLPGSDPKGRGE